MNQSMLEWIEHSKEELRSNIGDWKNKSVYKTCMRALVNLGDLHIVVPNSMKQPEYMIDRRTGHISFRWKDSKCSYFLVAKGDETLLVTKTDLKDKSVVTERFMMEDGELVDLLKK